MTSESKVIYYTISNYNAIININVTRMEYYCLFIWFKLLIGILMLVDTLFTNVDLPLLSYIGKMDCFQKGGEECAM